MITVSDNIFKHIHTQTHKDIFNKDVLLFCRLLLVQNNIYLLFLLHKQSVIITLFHCIQNDFIKKYQVYAMKGFRKLFTG